MIDTEKKELMFNENAFFTYSEGASKEYTVEDKIRSKYMRVDFSVSGDTNRYTPGTKIVLKILYWNKDTNGVYGDGATQCITIVPTKNTDTKQIRIYANYIKEVVVESLGGSISDLRLYASKDLLDNQLVEVTKFETVYATVVQSKVSWTSSLIVDRIETNLECVVYKGDITTYVPPTSDTTMLREFMVMEKRTKSSCESVIDLTQFEDLKIMINGVETQVYWSAILNHVDAYKYFTLVPPEEVFEGISPEDAEKYKVKRFKAISTVVKYEDTFDETQLSDGSVIHYPIQIHGIGKDITGQSDWGKGKVYKNKDSFNIRYVNQQNEEIGFEIDDKAPRVHNKGNEGLHNNIILDHEPTDQDITLYSIKEYDIIFVVPKD